MLQKNNATGDKAISLHVVKPYDFALSLRAVRSFAPALSDHSDRLRLATRIDGTPTLIEVSQIQGAKGSLRAFSTPESDTGHLRTIVEWVLFAELDVVPFYRLTARDPKLMTMIKKTPWTQTHASCVSL